MIKTAIGAKRHATKHGYDVIGYDFDEGCWFGTFQGVPHGHFDKFGTFYEHRCVYMPAYWSAEKLEETSMDFAFRNRD